MKKTTKDFLKKNFPGLVNLYRKGIYLRDYFTNPMIRALERYKKAGGETLRITYDIHPNDIIFDLGGYKGDWTGAMLSKYNNIYIYIYI